MQEWVVLLLSLALAAVRKLMVTELQWLTLYVAITLGPRPSLAQLSVTCVWGLGTRLHSYDSQCDDIHTTKCTFLVPPIIYIFLLLLFFSLCHFLVYISECKVCIRRKLT